MPVDETFSLLQTMGEAEKTNDTLTLKWCYRRLLWIYNIILEKDGITKTDEGSLFCTGSEGEPVYSPRTFNRDYQKQIENDPQPVLKG